MPLYTLLCLGNFETNPQKHWDEDIVVLFTKKKKAGGGCHFIAKQNKSTEGC